MASFTEFKLSLGIKTSDNDTEYASILKALIKELYSTYGIALTKDIESASTIINTPYDIEVQLPYKNIVSGTISGATEGTDFTIDKISGTVTILSTGSLIENTNYTLTFTYYTFLNGSNEIIKEIYTQDTDLSYYVDINPCKLLKVEYNNTVLTQDTEYYFYNRNFELATANLNPRIPYKLYLEVGYEEIPLDLKRAFYELASIRLDMITNKTYLVDKVNNSTNGTTTTYSKDTTPSHIQNIFMEYTGRRFVV